MWHHFGKGIKNINPAIKANPEKIEIEEITAKYNLQIPQKLLKKLDLLKQQLHQKCSGSP